MNEKIWSFTFALLVLASMMPMGDSSELSKRRLQGQQVATNAPHHHTHTPTMSPTPSRAGATTSPTESPSTESIRSSSSPTSLPTAAPSVALVVQQNTGSPTAFPTGSPTQLDILESSSPTSVPSMVPSFGPKKESTRSPTVNTVAPTAEPIATPAPTFSTSINDTTHDKGNKTQIPEDETSSRESDALLLFILGAGFILSGGILCFCRAERASAYRAFKAREERAMRRSQDGEFQSIGARDAAGMHSLDIM